MRVAVVFPGQGNQAPGFGQTWAGSSEWALVDRAETSLGQPLGARGSLVGGLGGRIESQSLVDRVRQEVVDADGIPGPCPTDKRARTVLAMRLVVVAFLH